MEITQSKSSWQHDITPLLGGPIFSLIKSHSYQAKIFLLYHIDAESEGMNPRWNYRNLGQVLINPTKVGPTLHRVRPASSWDYSWLGSQFKGEDHQMDGAAFLAHHQQSIHDKTRSIRVGPTRWSSDDFEILRTARGRKLLPHNYFLRYLLSLLGIHERRKPDRNLRETWAGFHASENPTRNQRRNRKPQRKNLVFQVTHEIHEKSGKKKNLFGHF